MKKIRLRKYDKFRVLLTEVLPFEVPLIFSNTGLYQYFVDKPAISSKVLSGILNESFGYTIPFNYNVIVNPKKNRELSVIHPAIQRKFADFYENYSDLILSLCSKSEVSLRSPARVASHFFERGFVEVGDAADRGVELDRPVADLEFSSSYYVYKSYSFIYQFYDSFELINLEKRFKSQMWFDISKCFYNLYTHTISWAVRDKDFSKENLGSHSFDSEFDSLMMMANFKETNGVVVGPEFSRIFAEIILQKIDAGAVSSLEKSKNSIKYGRDYVVKRYVDDYFVFANDENVLNTVFRTYSSLLSQYKLFVNDAKCKISNAPFITKLSRSKSEIGRLLKYFASDIGIRYHAESSSSIFSVGGYEGGVFDESRQHKVNRSRVSKLYINRLREIVAESDSGFESSSKYIIGCLNRLCSSLQNFGIPSGIDKRFYEYIYSILMVILEIGFYAYLMAPNVSATYKISRLVYFTEVLSINLPTDFREVIEKYISDEIIRAINSISRETNGLSVEVLNLIILLKDVGGDYNLSERDFHDLLLRSDSILPDGSLRNLNYFQIITLLFYFGSDSAYFSSKDRVINFLTAKILGKNEPFICAESAMLILDIMRCPFVSELNKVELLEGLHNKCFGTVPPAGGLVHEVRQLASIEWFARWDATIDFGALLQKKELRSPY